MYFSVPLQQHLKLHTAPLPPNSFSFPLLQKVFSFTPQAAVRANPISRVKQKLNEIIGSGYYSPPKCFCLSFKSVSQDPCEQLDHLEPAQTSFWTQHQHIDFMHIHTPTSSSRSGVVSPGLFLDYCLLRGDTSSSALYGKNSGAAPNGHRLMKISANGSIAWRFEKNSIKCSHVESLDNENTCQVEAQPYRVLDNVLQGSGNGKLILEVAMPHR